MKILQYDKYNDNVICPKWVFYFVRSYHFENKWIDLVEEILRTILLLPILLLFVVAFSPYIIVKDRKRIFNFIKEKTRFTLWDRHLSKAKLTKDSSEYSDVFIEIT